MVRQRITVLAFLTAAGMSLPVEAQEYGQWWWSGQLGLYQRQYQNSTDGREVAPYDERGLRLGLGLNGFILHPTIAEFGLGLDFLANRFDGAGRNNNTWGASANLLLFPRGKATLRLFASRRQYDFFNLPDRDPADLQTQVLPDVTTSYGARLRVRKGLFGGLLLGFTTWRLSFLDLDQDETGSRAFADWSGTSLKGSLQHHYRLENLSQSYATTGYQYDHTTLTIDEHGPISPRWRWDFSGVGIDRKFGFDGTQGDGFRRLRVNNVMTRQLGSDDRLLLTYRGFITEDDSGFSNEGHQVSGTYLWAPRSDMTVGPFLSYSHRKSEFESSAAPEIGTSFNWASGFGPVASQLSVSASYGELIQKGDESIPAQEFVSMRMNFSLGYGDRRTVRTELEGGVGRNQVDIEGITPPDLPELGLIAPGTQDGARARLNFFKDWHGADLSAYGEWSLRISEDEFLETEARAERLTASLAANWGRFAARANIGETNVSSAIDQTVRFSAAFISWSPFRRLTLTGSYRSDTRVVLIGPDVDGARIEASLDFVIGQTVLHARAYNDRQRVENGVERTNRGLYWSLSRSFSGWLPVVTGPRRRGVVR